MITKLIKRGFSEFEEGFTIFIGDLKFEGHYLIPANANTLHEYHPEITFVTVETQNETKYYNFFTNYQ